MKSKKIAIFGAKSTTQSLIYNLSSHIDIEYLITIDKNTAIKNNVADYFDLTDTCKKYGIKKYTANSYSLNNEKDQLFFDNEKLDLIFVIGWQRIIPQTILKNFSIGAFGMHGSSMDLPLGRGRSPMNWALIEGKAQFYTNLFKYDPGVDSGDILDSYKFEITTKDTAETLHYKNTLSMIFLVKNNLKKLLINDFELRKQNSYIEPTYYPKRQPSDSLIDWNLDITSLDRFIRAVTLPFNGAYTYLDSGEKLIILEAQIFDLNDFGFSIATVAEVVQVFSNGKFLIKVIGGLLFVNKYICATSILEGFKFNDGIEKRNIFKRNNQGYFDNSI